MKAIALAALALGTMATPALAGPYVESKHEFKGTDEDYSKAVHQARIGYETKVGKFSPYIEGGVGAVYPDGSIDSTTFTALEVGSKVKITDNFSGYGKFETIMYSEKDDWKVEFGTKYKF
jgi:outer membrane autotransporter protein